MELLKFAKDFSMIDSLTMSNTVGQIDPKPAFGLFHIRLHGQYPTLYLQAFLCNFKYLNVKIDNCFYIVDKFIDK